MLERDPRAKSPVGRLLSMGKEVEARQLILRVAKGADGTGPALSHNVLCDRLGVHRQSLWRYFNRLEGMKDEVECIYAQALLANPTLRPKDDRGRPRSATNPLPVVPNVTTILTTHPKPNGK